MKNECHQHKVKMRNLNVDLKEFNLTQGELENIKISDLEFKVIKKTDSNSIRKVINFIERYEWLGKINNYWNFAFALTYKDKIVTVIMIGTPNMFSKLLGEDTKDLEQTLHRGASSSIAPKNSGSYLISKSIDWMVRNTPYKVFSGYSTTHEANEYGYIYQSLNFICVSKKSGTRLEYLKPGTQDRWLSDRHLRKISNYKKVSKKLGIEWKKDWNTQWKIHWDKMPRQIEASIRHEQKEDMKTLTFRKVHPKLRYVLIKGNNKRETKHLLRLFKEQNPKLVNKDGSLGLPYPKKDQACKNVATESIGVENDIKIQ